MDIQKHAKTLLEQKITPQISGKTEGIISSRDLYLYGKNPRHCSAIFAREQAISRLKKVEKGMIEAFGMQDLISNLEKENDLEKISYYSVKTKTHAGEIYFKGDIALGVQFVRKGREKYSRGLDLKKLES